MNAVTPIQVDENDAGWARAIQAANLWRGQAIQCFAKAEAAVSEALLALAAAEGRGEKVPLRPLFGQRFQDLRDSLGEGGPFAAEGVAATRALAAFHELEHHRTALCHGVATIGVDRKGQWFVALRLLAFHRRCEQRSAITLHQREAEALLVDIRKRGTSLSSALGALRATLPR